MEEATVLVAMSMFGLWAASMVLIRYNTLHKVLPYCTPTNQSGGIVVDCGKALSSKYSMIFGIPLEVLAVFYFIVNLGLIYLIAFWSDRMYNNSFRALFVWRFFGIVMVPHLVTVESFIIKAVCLYCTVMHIAIIVDFVIIRYLLFYKKEMKELQVIRSTQGQSDFFHHRTVLLSMR